MELSYTKIKVNKLFEPTLKHYGIHINGEWPTLEILKDSGYKYGVYKHNGYEANIYYYHDSADIFDELKKEVEWQLGSRGKISFEEWNWTIIDFDFDCDLNGIDYNDAKNYLMYNEGTRTKERMIQLNEEFTSLIED